MLKIRLTFVNDENGRAELAESLKKIYKNFKVISESKIYNGRNGSPFANVYVDVENK